MRITALKVNQWLDIWNNVIFNEDEFQKKPDPYFYLFAMEAKTLNQYSDVYRRDKDTPSTEDEGIQRVLEVKRSSEISRFITHGFPVSEKEINKYSKIDLELLQKPGWLPTAIVINILVKGDKRLGKTISERNLIKINESDDNNKSNIAEIVFPEIDTADFTPPPIEIIDGQHRLKAFSEDIDMKGNFEVPVVAFVGLDVSWKAYLFWVINIKPKRITPSLAFDLYPLLRREAWLEQGTQLYVYRETRAQEIVDYLWAHPDSPWYRKINMLGDRSGGKNISQSAMINSILVSFIKQESRSSPYLGGFYGGGGCAGNKSPNWNRHQQVAFLIFFWRGFFEKIISSNVKWFINSYHQYEESDTKDRMSKRDYIMSNNFLLNADQGFRGVMQVLNGVLYFTIDDLDFEKFELGDNVLDTDQEINDLYSISKYIKEFENSHDLANLIYSLVLVLTGFDWRSSSDKSIDESNLLTKKKSYRGGSGYKEIRTDILGFIERNTSEPIIQQAIEKIKDSY